MKPTTKKTVATKPEAQNTEPTTAAAENADAGAATEAENSGEDLDETSDEEPTEAVVTEEVAQDAVAEEPTAAAAQEQPPSAPAKSGDVKEVMLGAAPATLLRMPSAVVWSALSDTHQARINILRTDRSISDLQDRMRSTDGRCAPVIFTYNPEDKTVPPALFSGIESVAAALNLELPELSVLLVANADASNAQGYLNAMQRNKPTSGEDDFLMRVQSFYD